MKRIDGRGFDELRELKIERSYIKHAEGSCLAQMGDTKVICTASFDKNVPPFLRNSGTGWLTAEYGMLPRSTNVRIQRDKKSGRTMEIQRLIGRSLRSVVDLDLLGEKTIYVDCDVIQADGGTRITSIIGGYVALVDCVYNLCKQNLADAMCVTGLLGAVSVGVYKGKLILDLNYEEDSKAKVDMNVVMKSSGEFIELQGTAEHGSFSQDELTSFIALAKKGIMEIIDLERSLFKDIPGVNKF